MKSIIKHKRRSSILALCCVCVGNLIAQNTEKLNEKFTVNNDVVVKLNTSYTNVVFETWNRNTVEVEAYVEGEKLTDDQRKYLAETWQIEAIGNSREIAIRSIAKSNPKWNETITKVNINNPQELKNLTPVLKELLAPIMKNIDKNPMPSALKENLASLDFNYKAYQKDEEKYLVQWEKQIKEKLGNSTNNVSGNSTLQLTDQIGRNNQIQVLDQGLRNNNQWRGDFSREMEAWASQFINQMANVNGGNITLYSSVKTRNTKDITSNRVIKIKMPKGATVGMNVRHGKVQLAPRAINVKASLSHTQLIADVVDGKQTDIRVSYSPVIVNEWNNGRLVVNYVKNCRIENANNIQINADSSNIFIDELLSNGAIAGSFGNITIANIKNSFSALDLILENCDLKIEIPKTAFNFTYSGARSRIKLPTTMQAKSRRSLGGEFINGYHTTRNTDKAIVINAKYSDVILQ